MRGRYTGQLAVFFILLLVTLAFQNCGKPPALSVVAGNGEPYEGRTQIPDPNQPESDFGRDTGADNIKQPPQGPDHDFAGSDSIEATLPITGAVYCAPSADDVGLPVLRFENIDEDGAEVFLIQSGSASLTSTTIKFDSNGSSTTDIRLLNGDSIIRLQLVHIDMVLKLTLASNPSAVFKLGCIDE